MTDEQWKEFYPYFTPEECGQEMDYSFMRQVLSFRLSINKPMRINSGYSTTGHSKHSMHYLGRAIDFYIDNDPRQTLRILDEHKFGAVGIYYHGFTYNKTKIPYFHIDNREPSRYQRWKSPSPDEYIYMVDNS